MDYAEFIASKQPKISPVGFSEIPPLHESLFPHQSAIVRWALRLGRAAIFADTGLGKTRKEIEYARIVTGLTGLPVLVVAPIAVIPQTIKEGAKMGVDIGLHDGAEMIRMVNYESIHKIDPDEYTGVVLDESSILKSATGKVRTALIEMFRDHRFKIAATATPAPNDHTELGNHAEFLGICTRAEMLAEYFVHDGGSTQNWRLKGHAREKFWQWVATWAVLVRKPSDLGFEDDRYDLPPFNLIERVVKSEQSDLDDGVLIKSAAIGLREQRAAKKATLAQRCKLAAEIVASKPGESWLIWGEGVDECTLTTSLIQDAVQVEGKDKIEDKAERLIGFQEGRYRVLVTKPKIAGFGMNWQHCHNMIFLGATNSFEQFYQAARRCWRFGQPNIVNIYVIRSDLTGNVWLNLKEKMEKHEEMAAEMTSYVKDSQLANVLGKRPGERRPNLEPIEVPKWLIESSQEM